MVWLVLDCLRQGRTYVRTYVCMYVPIHPLLAGLRLAGISGWPQTQKDQPTSASTVLGWPNLKYVAFKLIYRLSTTGI